MQAKDRYFSPALRCAGVLLGLLLCGAACLAQSRRRPRPAASSSPTCWSRATGSSPPSKSWPRSRRGPAPPTRAETVQEDVRTLVATRQFANVKADYRPEPDGKITVIFTVQDQANLVQRIVYNGAKHLGRTDDDLNQITGLRIGMPLDPITNRAACQPIVDKLNEDGRPFASCELLRGDQPGDTEVIFNIGEGR